MSDAPGWDAIDGVLANFYGDQVPKHWGTVIRYSLGGPDPLDGISAYDAGDHWHYVTFGLSELYGKESPEPSVSGFGFELTFRLKKTAPDPPTWPLNFLNNAARYVFNTGNTFAPGHHTNLNGPIALDEKTDIAAALFAADPDLPELDSPNGRVAFVQIVGVTLDEYQAASRWNTAGMLEVMARMNSKLVTDLRRRSILMDPASARLVAERTEQEGSSQGSLYVAALGWTADADHAELTLSALAVPEVVDALKGRLGHGRDFLLVCNELEVLLRPREKSRWGSKKNDGFAELAPEVVDALRKTLQPRRGVYVVATFPGFAIRVVPTEIKAQDGTVIRVVG